MSPRVEQKQTKSSAVSLKRCRTIRGVIRVKKERADAHAGSLTPRTCRAILRKVAAISIVPREIQNNVAELSGSLQGKIKSAPDCLAPQLGDVLRQVNEVLLAKKKEAQAKLDNGDSDMVARVETQSAAEQRILEVRRDITEKKSSIKEAEKEIGTQKVEVGNAKAAQKIAESGIKHVEMKRKHLDDIENDAFLPLKGEAAVGTQGQKRLKALRQVGQAYGFHPELLQVMPSIFKKELDKRRTFDNVAMQHFEVELAKQSSALQQALMNGAHVIGERAAAVQVAHQEVVRARDEFKQRGRDLRHLEILLQESRDALVVARQCVRNFPKDMKLAKQEIARAEARLLQFHKGPLAAFSHALPRKHTEIEDMKCAKQEIVRVETRCPRKHTQIEDFAEGFENDRQRGVSFGS